MNATRMLSCLLAGLIAGIAAEDAQATFHFMQVEQVIGGVNGDTSAQAVQLRMRSGAQNFISVSRIRVFDAAGQNPVLIVDFTTNVSNGSFGDRVLVTTTAFNPLTNPTTVPDFTMTNRIPDSYLAAGSLTFEDDSGSVYWRLSWGGASYTGSTTGLITNDNNGDFGPPYPGPLPSSDLRALQFQGSAGASSTSNENDYALTDGAATFTNNARNSFTLTAAGATGACCDRGTLTCTEDQTQSDCESAGFEYGGDNSSCQDFKPPCASVGACCDDATGVCSPDVAEEDCQGPSERFGGNGSSCGDFDPACAPEGAGACCNQRDGTCTEGVAESDCAGVGLRFGGDGSVCADFDTPCVQPISISLEPIAGGGGTVAGGGTLTAPLMVTHAGDGSGRLFIVDQIGQIRIVDAGGNLLPTPFLDIASKMVSVGIEFGPGFVFDERGLLGLAFHPGYETNGRFFVRYSAPRTSAGDEPCDPVNFPFSTVDGEAVGCHKEVLAEYAVSGGDPNVADPNSETVLFEVDEPQFNHNSGHVAFGPDGLLYWTLGDGGGAHDGLADDPPSHGPDGNAQNPETALGNILRIDVDSAPDPGLPYKIPPGNPFADGVDGVPEIYAYGFRNPYRFGFDVVGKEHLLIVADVGQNLFEELDLVPVLAAPGLLNYGWVIREAFVCFDPFNPTVPLPSCPNTGPFGETMIDPILAYDHGVGIAIIAGGIYKGTYPPLQGKYVFGDFSQDFGPTGRLFYTDVEGPEAFVLKEFFLAPPGLPLGQAMFGLGEGEDGEMYVCASDNIGPVGNVGVVYRIVVPTPAESTLASRYLSIEPPPSPTPYALAVTPDCPAGQTQYVGAPLEVTTNTGTERIAFLVSDPLDAARLRSDEWGSPVHVTGLDIFPETGYNIVTDFGTVGSPVLSNAAVATTNELGDVVSPFGGTGQPSFVDIGSVVLKFKDLPTAPPLHRAEQNGRGETPCVPDQSVGFVDIGATVLGFKSLPLNCPDPCN